MKNITYETDEETNNISRDIDELKESINIQFKSLEAKISANQSELSRLLKEENEKLIAMNTMMNNFESKLAENIRISLNKKRPDVRVKSPDQRRTKYAGIIPAYVSEGKIPYLFGYASSHELKNRADFSNDISGY